MYDMNNQDSTDELRDRVELGNLLKELMYYKPFQKVILEHYMEDTLINESENLTSENDEIRSQALGKVNGITYLKRHLTQLLTEASCAEEDLIEENR